MISKKGIWSDIRTIVLALVLLAVILGLIIARFPRILKAYTQGSNLDPDTIMSKANEAFEQKEYEAAIQLYRDFLRKFPNHKDAYLAQYKIGESYYEMEEWNLAYIAYKDTQKMEPDEKWQQKVNLDDKIEETDELRQEIV